MRTADSGENEVGPREAFSNDQTDFALLRAVQDGGPLDDVASRAGVPRATAHRRLRRMIEKGVVEKTGTAFHISEAGRRFLAGASLTSFPPSHLEKRWSFLALLPSAVHRALVIIVLALFVARRDRLVEDLHAGIVIGGTTQKLKSLIIRICCFLLGAQPRDCEVPLMGVRGRGLILRLDARGEAVRQCKALEQPLVWLHEGSRMDPSVKRDLMAIFWGSSKAKVEDHEVPVDGVPILEMNWRKNAGTLEEKLGLDVPVIRRAFVVDVTRVDVSAKVRAASGETLGKFQALGAVELPLAPKTPLPQACRELLQRAYEECVRPEEVDSVDPARALTVILGLRAVLPEREALEVGIYNVFLLYETTGFLQPDWRSRLALLLAPESAAAPALEAKPQDSADLVPAVCPAEEPNPFDLQSNLLALRYMLAQVDPRLLAEPELLRRYTEGYLRLRENGFEPEVLDAVAGDLPFLLNLRAIAQKAGLDEENLVYLARLVTVLRAGGWSIEDVDGFLVNYSELSRLGVSLDDNLVLARRVQAARASKPELAEALDFLLQQAAECIPIQEAHARLIERISGLERGCSSLSQHLAQSTGELQTLQTELVNADRELARKGEEVSMLDSALEERRTQLAELESACSESVGRVEAARQEEQSIRARTMMGLIVSEFLFNPRRLRDAELANLVDEFLSAQKWGMQARVDEALAKIEVRGRALLEQSTLPEDEVEERKAKLLSLRTECADLERRLVEARNVIRLAEERNWFVTALLVVLLPQNDEQRKMSRSLAPEVRTLFEILANEGFHLDRPRELQAQMEKVLAMILSFQTVASQALSSAK